MTSQPAMRLYEYALAANGQVWLDIDGDYLACLDATGAFQMRLDGNPFTDFSAGLKVKASPGTKFTQVQLKDTSGGANVISFIVGYGDFEDARLTLTGAVSLANSANLVTAADVALGAAVATVIAAASTTRREILIHNNTGAAIRVGDANVAAARGVQIAAGAVLTLATGAAVYGYSVAGGNVSFTEVRD